MIGWAQYVAIMRFTNLLNLGRARTEKRAPACKLSILTRVSDLGAILSYGLHSRARALAYRIEWPQHWTTIFC